MHLIITRNFTAKEMYDDGGYCDTKIPRYGHYFDVFQEEGSETMCSDCLVNALLSIHDPKSFWYNATFEYHDNWFNQQEAFVAATKK